MAGSPEYEIAQGATLTFLVDAVSGDLSGSSAAADVKAFANGQPVGAALITTVPVYSASIEGGGPGWYIPIPAAETRDLEPGIYATDVRIEKAGAVDVTERILFRVREAVTLRP